MSGCSLTLLLLPALCNTVCLVFCPLPQIVYFCGADACVTLCEIDKLYVSSPPLCSTPQANLDDSQMSSSPFLRALMTAVCKAAVKGKHPHHLQDTILHFGSNRTTDCNIYTLPNAEPSSALCTHSAPCFTAQMITPTVEWTRPSSRGDCLYYSSTLTQTLSDSCKHFMHFRR